MPPVPIPKPGIQNRQDDSLWSTSGHSQNILIPLEVDNAHFITGFVVLEDNEFPEGGQNTVYDYASSSFREGHASLTIHRELGDPTLEDGYSITLLKLAYSIDRCNFFSRNHAVKTAFWARKIAEKIGLSDEELEQVELASKLHDIGKVVVPKPVLTKPSHLSEQEWTIMRRHPTFGAMIMKPSRRLHKLIPYVKSHHEKYDGTGYPSRLVGDQIPLPARIIAIADSYATITDGRVYQPPGTRSDALTELERWSGKQFDPHIISIMIGLVTSGRVDDSHVSWESLGKLPGT